MDKSQILSDMDICSPHRLFTSNQQDDEDLFHDASSDEEYTQASYPVRDSEISQVINSYSQEHTPAQLTDDEVSDSVSYLATHQISAESLDSDDLEQWLTWFERRFCETVIPEQVMQKNIKLFGSFSSINNSYKVYCGAVVSLSNDLQGKLEEGTVTQDRYNDDSKRITRILASILHARESLVYLYNQVFMNNDNMGGITLKPSMSELINTVIDTDENSIQELKPHQQLLVFFLTQTRRLKLRKVQGETAMYSPRFTKDGLYTYSFVYKYDIEDFIYDAIYPVQNNLQLFDWMTKAPHAPKTCIDYLSKCVDDRFPTIDKCRYQFSFNNGVFDAEKNRFYPYVEIVGHDYKSSDLGSDRISCNFIDQAFEYEQYAVHDDPYDIATPNCQRILDSQGFSREVCKWSYASIGRLMFDVGHLDNWQYFPFYKGVAGSGKSTLLNLASEFYLPSDVGSMMSESQKTFSVEHLYNKLVFFCMDIDDKLTFSQTRWNMMVSGERMSIERKYKIALDKKWSAPGAFAGNTYPPWIDNGGSMTRRLLIFLFEERVLTVDPHLAANCRKELPAFMYKCASCYHEMLTLYGDRGIWDEGVLPEEFISWQNNMRANSNSLIAFLESRQCVFRDDATCAQIIFQNYYSTFCRQNQLSSLINGKDRTVILSEYGITPDVSHDIGPIWMGITFSN